MTILEVTFERLQRTCATEVSNFHSVYGIFIFSKSFKSVIIFKQIFVAKKGWKKLLVCFPVAETKLKVKVVLEGFLSCFSSKKDLLTFVYQHNFTEKDKLNFYQ